MWCVIYGHTINVLLCGAPHPPVWLHTFVRTFDMPFFMVLSGYFLKKSLEKREWWVVFANRITMIFVPIAVWTLLTCHVSYTMYYFLWAVLISSLICIAGNRMLAWAPKRPREPLELLLYICVAVLLHVVKVPWNLFYLFPFFVFGYYMRDVKFELSRRALCVMGCVFVVLLCFWKPSYTPWNMGALAWKDSPAAMLIYGYRFLLGIVGVCVMAKAFDMARIFLSDDSFLVRMLTRFGRETLALYILQSIAIERIVRVGCDVMYRHSGIVLTQSAVKLVGYAIAPVVSFLAMLGLAFATEKIKNAGGLKYMFGFKLQ